MTSPAAPRDLVLSNLSWPEIRDIRDQVEVVLLPIGSNEQHGPNLAVDFDITAAYEFSRRASARLYPRLIVAPPIPWGVSFHHMNFPGTITLSVNTFMQVLVEVVASLKAHGFERFLIVNGHGGNIQPMGAAVVRIQEEVNPHFIGACSHFSFQDRAGANQRHGISGITGHACENETAVGMYMAPQTVKTDALAAGELTPSPTASARPWRATASPSPTASTNSPPTARSATPATPPGNTAATSSRAASTTSPPSSTSSSRTRRWRGKAVCQCVRKSVRPYSNPRAHRHTDALTH